MTASILDLIGLTTPSNEDLEALGNRLMKPDSYMGGLPVDDLMMAASAIWELRDLRARIEALTAALRFVHDLAAEELPYASVGTGGEVVLRHIKRKTEEVLADVPQTAEAAENRP